MGESTFRKMQCNAGHFSRVFAADEALPRRCPVCGQPYDRRYNRPILCHEDGSVLDTEAEAGEGNAFTGGESPEETLKEAKQKEPEPAAKAEESVVREAGGGGAAEAPEYFRRGRQMSSLNIQNPVSPQSGRRAMQQRDTAEPETGTSGMGVAPIALFTGGHKIEIPGQGGYLGREGLGKESFMMNPLVSRKHAYVRADHFGSLQVRDADSLNGTYVDDGSGRRRLKPDETAVLKAGNTIWAANQILAVAEDEL